MDLTADANDDDKRRILGSLILQRVVCNGENGDEAEGNIIWQGYSDLGVRLSVKKVQVQDQLGPLQRFPHSSFLIHRHNVFVSLVISVFIILLFFVGAAKCAT
jgi:hypothetical protein